MCTYKYNSEYLDYLNWSINNLKKIIMTQKTKVLNYLNNNEKATIKQCSSDLDIVEPNIRRILGVGTKEGLFERLGPGVYQITIEGKNVLYLYEGDCLGILPQLIENGLKADNIFLDIPYDTPAVKEEYINICSLFNDEEIELLSLIN